MTRLRIAIHSDLREHGDQATVYREALDLFTHAERLGFETAHASGSWENGTAAVGAFLNRAGVPQSEYHLDDGCGLSKENSIAARAIGATSDRAVAAIVMAICPLPASVGSLHPKAASLADHGVRRSI